MIDTTTIIYRKKCYHQNGWNKYITFNFLWFKFKRKFFLCTDCEDIIPIDDAKRIWNEVKK